MIAGRASLVLAVTLLGGCRPAHAAPGLVRVSPSALEVTSGRVEAAAAGFHVDVPGMRAVARGMRARAVELAFTYRGPTERQAPLASGEVRRQIGLKLRAQDTCNVVYVMWHVEPSPGVAVSVKSNPGAHAHADCGAGGYVNLPRQERGATPLAGAGERHVLRAELADRDLVVKADGRVVWSGPLPPEALAFDGPVGVRSDNGRFDFVLEVAPP